MIRKKPNQNTLPEQTHKTNIPERDFKGIWIPREIWYNKNLTLHEKHFLLEIDSLDGDKGCYASNKHFSEFFGVSPGRCTQIIKAIEKKGYVSIQLHKKGKQIIKRTIRVVNKLNRGSEYIKYPYLENDDESNTYKSNTYKKNKTKKVLNGSTIKTFKKHLPKEFLKNKELIPTIKEFIAHRNEKKKPLTERSIKMICTKCKRFKPKEVQIAFEESTIAGYASIFPKKEYKNNYTKKDQHAPNAVRAPKDTVYGKAQYTWDGETMIPNKEMQKRIDAGETEQLT